jgi:hypothetical protein
MTIYSERAERSRNLVNLALAHYRQTAGSTERVRLGLPRSPRRRGRRSAVPETFRTHDAILRIVAVAEDFSFSQLIDVTEARLPTDRIVQSLWDSELERSGDTWGRRLELWRRFHEVRIGDSFSSYAELNGFIEARNAIAHGLGQLTRKQLRDRGKTVGRLANADIHLHGNTLVVTATHVERCATVVKDFIIWLDQEPLAA